MLKGVEAVKLYETLAADIASQIAQGVIREGERIPSVRRTSQHHNLSVSTVIRAFLLLESQGLIESRPQSGYFVQRQPALPRLPPNRPHRPPWRAAKRWTPANSCSPPCARSIRAACRSAPPIPILPVPVGALNQYANSAARRVGQMGITADLPPGIRS
jgi:DNA-binding transcriptional MocR family regulator